MATIEKELKTRIQLKYDSFANWNSNGALVLKTGEIGICAVPSGSNAVNGDASRPQILFKVGDGTSTFANLPWASAKAADVYDWAKQASLPVTKVGTGNVVQSIEWDATNKGIKFTTASVATSEGLKEVEDNLSELTTKVNAMYTNAQIDSMVAAAKKAGDDAADALDTYKTANDARVLGVENSIATINDNTNGILAQAKAYADGKDSAMDKRVDTLEAIDHSLYAVKTEVAATYETIANVSAYKTSNDSRVKAVEDSIAGINNASSGILAQAKAYADKKDNAMDLRVDALEAIKHEEFAKSADVVDNDTFDAFKTANTAAIAKAAGDAETAAKAYADGLKDEILGEGIKDTFDTLVEIQTWIEGAGVNATELTEAIAAEAKLRGDEDTRLAELISAMDTAYQAADAGLDAKITKIENGNTVVAKASHAVNADNATNAANATKASQDADGNVITSTYETKTDASNKLTEAKNYTNTVAGNINTAYQAADSVLGNRISTVEGYFTNGVAKTAAKVSNNLTIKDITGTQHTYNGSSALSLDFSNVADKAYADQAESDAVNTAKTYTNSVAANINTAWQAGDATLSNNITNVSNRVTTLENNHVKDITGGTGLVAEKTGNAYSIAFDDECVFIFNCGSSTQVI